MLITTMNYSRYVCIIKSYVCWFLTPSISLWYHHEATSYPSGAPPVMFVG